MHDKSGYFHKDFSNRTVSSQIDRLDSQLAKLDKTTSDIAIQVLTGLDRLQERLKEENRSFSESESDDPQLHYLIKRFQSNADTLVTAVGGVDALRKLRSEYQPSTDAWWWHIDEYIKKRNQIRFRRLVIIGGGIVAIFAILVVVYLRFLAPPPEVRQRIGHENKANSLIENSQFQDALDQTNMALEYAPENFSLIVQKGVLLEMLNQPEMAQESYNLALRTDPDKTKFLLERAYAYLKVGQFEKMKADAEELVALNPDSAEGYMFIANAYEIAGDDSKAIQNYEKASTLAEAQDKIELMTTIRVRMGFLMQNFSMPTSTPSN